MILASLDDPQVRGALRLEYLELVAAIPENPSEPPNPEIPDTEVSEDTPIKPESPAILPSPEVEKSLSRGARNRNVMLPVVDSDVSS